jgi:hypothetical protein
MADVYSAPAVKARAVTKSDTTVVACRALYVGGAGNVTVLMEGDAASGGSGTAVEFVGVPAGTVLPISCNKVMAATTATSIVALY